MADLAEDDKEVNWYIAGIMFALMIFGTVNMIKWIIAAPTEPVSDFWPDQYIIHMKILV